MPTQKPKPIEIELPADPSPCSFCGKTHGVDGVPILYGHGGVAICHECAGRYVLSLERKLGRDWIRKRPWIR